MITGMRGSDAFNRMNKRRASGLNGQFLRIKVDLPAFFLLFICQYNIVIAFNESRTGLHQGWQRLRPLRIEHFIQRTTKLPAQVQSRFKVVALVADKIMLGMERQQRKRLPFQAKSQTMRIFACLAAAASDINFIAIPLEPASIGGKMVTQCGVQLHIPAARRPFIEGKVSVIGQETVISRVPPVAERVIVVS